MGGGCSGLLERSLEALRDFNASMIDGRLVVYAATQRLTFVFAAECTDDDRIMMMTGYARFFRLLPRENCSGTRLLERVLELGGSHNLFPSKLDDSLILSSPPINAGELEPEDIARFFSLTALVAVWLDRQLERASQGLEPEPFNLEEAARIIEEG